MIEEHRQILREHAALSRSMAIKIEAIAKAGHVNLGQQMRVLQALENDHAGQAKLIKTLWKLIPKPR